jgi:hypothetical protein
MGINSKKVQGNGGKDRVAQPNIDAGVYPGRLVQIIDLGMQPQRAFKGEAKPPAQRISLTYELVDEFMKDEDGEDILDKPRWVSEDFPLHNLKADLAISTKRYMAFDPSEAYEGDWSQCVGMPCNVTIVNNKVGDKIYDNVANVATMRPKDAAQCPELQNAAKVFDLDDPDMEVYNALPKWLQEKIAANLEYKGSPLEEKLSKAPEKASEEKKPKKNRAPVVEEDDADDNPY